MYNIVAIIKNQYVKGWKRPVTILLTDQGHTFMTEFNNKEIKPGLQPLKVSKRNSYGYSTVIL